MYLIMATLSNTKEQGFLMIDALVGLAVATMLSAAFISATASAVKISGEHAKKLQAELLLVELVEVLRDIEYRAVADPFTNCSSACHPVIQGGEWVLEEHAETVFGRFARSVAVEPVLRDAVSHELDPGGVLDPNSFKAIATVSWQSSGVSKNITLETFIYDLHENW